MATDAPRPAWYALAAGGWRDYVTLVHLPYTAWHLAYVAIGAALAPALDFPTLGLALAAFFLAVGIGAHALDELQGRPLGSSIPRRVLTVLAVTSIAGAAAIGIAGAVSRDPWLVAFVVAGVAIVCAYNLELAGGRFHTDGWFAAAWGGFPVLTGYFAMSGELRAEAIAAAAFATLLSLAQRRLSGHARAVRRSVDSVEGNLVRHDGTVEAITRGMLIGPHEAALRMLAAATCLLAAALVIMRA